MILVDTNVVLRAAQPSHAMHGVAVAAVERLRLANEVLCVVPQVFYEFWVVATRPAELNGLGMTVAEAHADIVMLLSRFRFFRDERSIFERWHQLVAQHQIVGRSAHDVRLVAAMERHSIRQILTFNISDFARFSGITVIDPRQAAVA